MSYHPNCAPPISFAASRCRLGVALSAARRALTFDPLARLFQYLADRPRSCIHLSNARMAPLISLKNSAENRLDFFYPIPSLLGIRLSLAKDVRERSEAVCNRTAISG